MCEISFALPVFVCGVELGIKKAMIYRPQDESNVIQNTEIIGLTKRELKFTCDYISVPPIIYL